MPKDSKFPTYERIRVATGSSYEFVPRGFAAWVKEIDTVLPAIASPINELLENNQPLEAVDIYEATGDDFYAWMKIMRQRNQPIF